MLVIAYPGIVVVSVVDADALYILFNVGFHQYSPSSVIVGCASCIQKFLLLEAILVRPKAYALSMSESVEAESTPPPALAVTYAESTMPITSSESKLLTSTSLLALRICDNLLDLVLGGGLGLPLYPPAADQPDRRGYKKAGLFLKRYPETR